MYMPIPIKKRTIVRIALFCRLDYFILSFRIFFCCLDYLNYPNIRLFNLCFSPFCRRTIRFFLEQSDKMTRRLKP